MRNYTLKGWVIAPTNRRTWHITTEARVLELIQDHCENPQETIRKAKIFSGVTFYVPGYKIRYNF